MSVDPPEHPGRQQAWIGGALLIAVPGVALRFGGGQPFPWLAAIIFGVAIIGAAFMLAWAAEVAQLDISQALALAVLAFIAVLPEYAVTFVFAAKAGHEPVANAPLVLANMTGANRLLIGVGWSMTVLLAAYRRRKLNASGAEVGGAGRDGVSLERGHSIEIAFLALATAYSLLLPLRRTLTVVDAAVLMLIFVAYVVRVSGAPAEEPHLVGPAQYLGSLSVAMRRVSIVVLFLLSAGAILACAEPFAEALVHTGSQLGIDDFLLVQWLAPLASEAPELLVAGLFAWRLRASTGLGSLVSSKVNQWTLLVGTVPVVYVVTSSSISGLPMNTLVREELFLTAAQSAFAVAILANRELSKRESVTLLSLFLAQFVLGGVLPEHLRAYDRIGFGILYMVLAAFVIGSGRRALPAILRDGFITPVKTLAEDDE